VGSSRPVRHAWGVMGALLLALGGLRGAAAQGVDLEGYKSQVFQLLNAQRSANGLPALRRVAPLDTAAQSYSDTMMRATAGGPVYLSHTSPDGTTFDSRIRQAGYDWFTIGENIAAGQKSPQEVVSAWMSSPGHRENILSPEFRDIGLGLAVGPGTWPGGFQDPQVFWWTTDFGNSRTNYGSDPPGGGTPPPPPAPAPVIAGYATASGTSTDSAPPATLIIVVGSNLGSSGTVRFNGIPASAVVSWSAAAIIVTVPAAPSYPSRGPVSVIVNGQTATGPDFTITAPPEPAPTPAPNPQPVVPPVVTPPSPAPDVPPSTPSGDWPMFMHDSRQLGLADSATDPRGLTPWSLSLGSRPGLSPVVQNGVAYLGTEAGSVFAIDTLTHTQRWSRPLPAPVRSALAATSQIVVASARGLYGLKTTDGTIVWQRPDIVADDDVSPTLVQNTVYIGARRPTGSGSALYAVDAATGTNVWPAPAALPDAAAVLASAAAEPSFGLLFVVTGPPGTSTDEGSRPGTVTALRLTNGTSAWKAPVILSGSPPAGLSVGPISSPGGAGRGLLVLFVAAGENVAALDAATGSPLWARTLADGDLHEPPILFSTASRGPVLLLGGTASRTNSGRIYTLDPSTGADKPANLLLPIGAVTGSMALAGSTLYVPTAGGLVAADASTGTVYWTSPFDAASGVAVAGGLPYVATAQGQFVGFSSTGAPAAPSGPMLHDVAIAGIQVAPTVSRSANAEVRVLLANRGSSNESYHIYLRFRPGDVLINDFTGTIEAGQTREIGFIWTASQMGENGPRTLVAQVLIIGQTDSNPNDNSLSQPVTVGP
jgi:outer membrane protein assembly factor BamB